MVMPSCLLANGTVMADAVMVVPSGTSSDRVTYTPTLTSGGTIDIYAKWTENANRSDNVRYTIHHSGGSSDKVVNQQQPSGEWFNLGAYAMAPGQNHRVKINGALEGETVADVGIDTELIMKIVGHSSVEMLLRYRIIRLINSMPPWPALTP